MFEKTIIRVAPYLGEVEQDFTKFHSLTALMWRSHEDDAVSREFDGSLVFKMALSHSIGVE